MFGRAFNNVQVSVQLSNSNLTAGDTLQGTVQVRPGKNVHEPLFVYVLGRERVGFQTDSSSSFPTPSEIVAASVNPMHDRNRRSARIRQFFQVEITIPHQMRPQSSNQFPFQCVLPASLPGSMDLMNGRLALEYVVRPQYGHHPSFGMPLCRFNLRAAPWPVTSRPTPYCMAPLEKALHGGILQLRTVGVLVVGARIPDTNVCRGRSVPLSITCSNRDPKDKKQVVEYVEIKVVEKTSWREHEHFPLVNSKKVLWEAKVNNPALFWKAGADGGMRNLSEGRQPITANISIPTLAGHSYKGILVQVEHTVKVTLQTAVLTENPFFKIPIRIGDASSSAPVVRQQATMGRPVIPGRVVLPTASASVVSSATATAVPTVSATVIPSAPATVVPSAPPTVTGVPVAAAVNPGNPLGIPMVSVLQLGGSSFANLGIQTVDSNGENDTADDPRMTSLEDLIPIAPPPPEPLLSALLHAMVHSINDVQIIQTRLQDPVWVDQVFSRLTPEEYGSILAHVHVDFDQPEVAELLVPVITPFFSCEYCVQAIVNACDWNRVNVVSRLLPHCRDLASGDGRAKIEAQLNEWELEITAVEFSRAMSNAEREAWSV